MEPNYILAGRLQRDYLLPPTGAPSIDVPGGNVLYAAAGIGVWETGVGLLGRAGEDYPQEWLRAFEQHGWDTGGIRILPEALDLRNFRAWTDVQNVQVTNPMAHFARMGLLFPKSLLGYQSRTAGEDDRKTVEAASPRPGDIPTNYLRTHYLHICPLDYSTSCRMFSAFKEGNATMMTLDPSLAYMNPSAFEDVRILLQGLTALEVSEEKLRGLFWGKTNDLQEMMEAVGSFGCEFTVVKRGMRGQMLYDAAGKKRWEIPAYPGRPIDLTGAGDAFCGGFLVGYQKKYDPLQAVLHGSISASLVMEGSGVVHALDTLPGLAKARMEALAGQVREV